MRERQKLPYSTIYVELDALLDTRWGTLVQHYPEETINKVLDSYHTRDSDYLKHLNAKQFLEHYKNRDIKTILNSVVTPIITMIKEFVAETLRNVLATPHHFQPKIVLNVYPYNLTESDIGALLSVVRFETSHHADIEVVNYPVSELDPEYINYHFAVVVMYHYELWLEHFSANKRFIDVQCPSVAMFAPRLNVENGSKLPDEFYEGFMEDAGPIIDLHLLPPEHFSLVLKKNPTPKEQKSTT